MAVVKTVGLDELREYMKTLPEDSAVFVKEEIGKSRLRVHSEVSGNFDSGGNSLKSRTGQLKRSLLTDLSGTKLNDIRGSVYTGKVYAPIHEEGGTITAKRAYSRVPGGPYLNIPLSANLTAAGVLRMGAREVFNAGGRLFKSRRGNWLVSLNGQLMFVLKKSVTIPARLGMGDAAEDEIPTLLGNISKQIQLRLEE